MSNQASTSSKRNDLYAETIKQTIDGIKTDLKKQKSTLKKMNSLNSVGLITRGNVTLDEILKFYTANQTLYISTEGFSVRNDMKEVMKKLEPSVGLSQLNITMGETKKVFDNMVKRLSESGVIREDACAELETVRERAKTQGNDCINTINLKINQAAQLMFVGWKQAASLENARLEYFKLGQSTEELNSDILNRVKQVRSTVEVVEQCSQQFKLIHSFIAMTHKIRRSPGPAQDGTASQFIEALNEFSKHLGSFTFKSKTKDPIARSMIDAFNKYQADVKLLVNHFKACAKIYKFGTQDLVRLGTRLSTNVFRNIEELTLLSMGLERVTLAADDLNVVSSTVAACELVFEETARFLKTCPVGEDHITNSMQELRIR